MTQSSRTPSEKKSILAARRKWRKYQNLRNGASVSNGEALSLGLVGSFTIDPLVPFLGVSLLERGVLQPALQVAPYDQIFQVCLDPQKQFETNVECVAIFWWIDDLLQKEFPSASDLGATEKLGRERIGDLVRAIRRLKEQLPGAVYVSVPPFMQGPGIDLLDFDQATGFGALHRSLVQVFIDLVKELEGVHLFDLDALQRYFGFAACFDVRKWYLYHQPYAEAFWYLVGDTLARLVAAQKIAPKKCVVLDCDNTLWGGTVGEDGLSGISLGSGFPGSAFLDFQTCLLALQRRGVLLALCSKNNEVDVWEVFDRHDGMVLKREHLSAWRINWEPKDNNLRALADELNIGLDSMVFVDDSPFEIESVQNALPELVCLKVPDDPARLPALLVNDHLFDRLSVTDEDRHRTEMMGQGMKRREAKGALSREEFLETLLLRVEVFEIEEEHAERVTQLINKTNQFNLTTRRRGACEVSELMKSAGHKVIGVKVSDRFGEYGLVGVVVVEMQVLENTRRQSGFGERLVEALGAQRRLGRVFEDHHVAGH